MERYQKCFLPRQAYIDIDSSHGIICVQRHSNRASKLESIELKFIAAVQIYTAGTNCHETI